MSALKKGTDIAIRSLVSSDKISNIRIVEDFQEFDPTININNYVEKIADHVCANIQAKAGMIPQDEIDASVVAAQSVKLKNTYGNSLLRESRNCCSFPGCGKPLYKEKNGKSQWIYEVTLIDKNNSEEFENLLAACPDCHATYLLDEDIKLMKTLLSVKNVLSKSVLSVSDIGDMKIEEGLVEALEKIKKLNIKDLEKPNLKPERIEDKIDIKKEPALYLLNRNLVTSYYITVRNILINYDKKGILDYEELQ